MITDRYEFSSQESIHFRVKGNGPHHVLFLHGFGASLLTWDDILPFFSPHEYTLHLLDLKGHGASVQNFRGDFSPQQNARIISAYIRSSGIFQVTVIGHSFGGSVGMLAALDLPQITRLILIGAPLFPQKIPKFMRIMGIPLIGPLLTKTSSARTIARQALEKVFFHHERITEQHVQRYALFYSSLASIRALACTVRQIIPPDIDRIIDRVATLSLPVLLLWGEQDRIVNPSQGMKLHATLKKSRMILIPDCGHNPHEELPLITYTLIRDFLQKFP